MGMVADHWPEAHRWNALPPATQFHEPSSLHAVPGPWVPPAPVPEEEPPAVVAAGLPPLVATVPAVAFVAAAVVANVLGSAAPVVLYPTVTKTPPGGDEELLLLLLRSTGVVGEIVETGITVRGNVRVMKLEQREDEVKEMEEEMVVAAVVVDNDGE